VLPLGRSRDWHNALMDYGALVLTGRVTGLSPRRRQTPFVGSRRWHRSRVLRRLLDEGPQSTEMLAGGLGLRGEAAEELLAELARDGLVVTDRGEARITTRADQRRP
jgi:A/G-specific adenine glycosylase